MLTREKIIELFEALNNKLSEAGESGEVGVIGGTAMCLAFKARESTKDVDAIFAPAATVRKLAARVAEEHGVDTDWINDAAKGFIEGNFKRVNILQFSHLRVWAPEARYLLAMKCLSARWDTLDRKDVKFLITLLKIKKKKEVFDIIESYYPKNRIPPKTQFLIEELLGK